MQERHTSFLNGLSPQDTAHLLERLQRRYFPAGATVIAEGAAVQDLYVIEAGSADVFIADNQGDERLVNRLGPGAVFGEMGLVTGLPASATVRATTDLAVVAMSEDDFYHAAAYPRLYRNLVASLSERLARSDRRPLRREHGHLTVLIDHGAPPLLGYALACSVAWHTRRSTLLLVVAAAEPAAALEALATSAETAPPDHPGNRPAAGGPGSSGAVGTHLTIATPTGAYGPEALAVTVDNLCFRYDHVLVQVPAAGTLPGLSARRVRLVGRHDAVPAEAGSPPGRTIRAWADNGSIGRPDGAGVLHVPVLNAEDEAALRSGLLPAGTPAGRALGWAARDLANLKVGLALGAGGTKGYAHIGVLRVLERVGFAPDYLAGTSIGAAVAALRALGYGAVESQQHLNAIGDTAWRLAMPMTGLLSSAGLRASIRQICRDRHIETLDPPLAVVAADIMTQREVVFRRGLLWSAVLASMSIPGIYPPLTMGQYILVDGGVLNPVPVDVAAAMGADIVIAVKLSRRPTVATAAEAGEIAGRSPPMVQTVMRAIELMQSKIVKHSAAAATIQIEPDLQDLADPGLRRFSQGQRYIAPGEIAAEAALPRIAAALPWLRSLARVD